MPQSPRLRRRCRAAILLAAACASLVLTASASAGVMVWAKNPSTDAPAGTWGEIWIANEDGSNAHVLLAPKGRLPGIPTPYAADRLYSPQLSDDGKTLTFTASWNRKWFSGLASGCGPFCEGAYQVRAGTITRVSPPVQPNTSINGCPGAAQFDLCSTFDSDAVQVGDSIFVADTQYYWTNCGASGCGQYSTASYNLIQVYSPKAGGGFDHTGFLNWDADCPQGSSEPQNTSFTANASGFIFTGCASGQGQPVSTVDGQGNQVDLARFYVSPMSLALAPDGSRVLAGAGRPGSGDDSAVWSFPVKPGGADALTPQEILVAIFDDDANGFAALTPTVGSSYIWTGGSDGNIHRWPIGCGVTISCRYGADDVKVTNDSGGELRDPGTGGYWTSFELFNSDPRWSPAAKAAIGSPVTPPPPPAKPVISKVGARCANAKGRCRLRLSWTASRAGTVTLTVKPFRKAAFSVAYTVKAGKASRTLAARKLPRGKTIVVTARLKAGGVKSAAVTVRPILR